MTGGILTHSPDRLYRALLERDTAFEGVFIVGVKTTGIFCRPTCRARKPKRQNVEFFSATGEAAQAGYRPCKVCRPTELPIEGVPPFFLDLSRRILEESNGRISDEEIRRMGYEPVTVRRWFNSRYRTTFHGWQRMVRLNSAFQRLQAGSNVTSAAFDSGYESLSGFGQSFKDTLGFAPSQKNSPDVIVAGQLDTPIGPLWACATNEGVCYLQFMDLHSLEDELADTCRGWKMRLIFGNHKHIDALKIELAEYFRGLRKHFDVPIALRGTDFQKKAWNQLLAVPYGTTVSYAQQAQALGSPGAARAVGTANRRNPLTILVPCHRVIGANGDLCGYAGGLWRKKWLLELEGVRAERRSEQRTSEAAKQAHLIRMP